MYGSQECQKRNLCDCPIEPLWSFRSGHDFAGFTSSLVGIFFAGEFHRTACFAPHSTAKKGGKSAGTNNDEKGQVSNRSHNSFGERANGKRKNSVAGRTSRTTTGESNDDGHWSWAREVFLPVTTPTVGVAANIVAVPRTFDARA